MPTPAPTVFPPQTSLSFDFSDWQVSNPGPLPGDQLDAQLVTLKNAHNTLLTFIDPLFNDDGTLANGSVGIGQLAPSAISEVGKPNADAAAASAAAAGASATQAANAASSAAGQVSIAAGHASTAAGHASTAAGAATTASTAATNAATSASTASTQAANAASSASAANTSKTQAQSAATAAAASAAAAAQDATNFGAELSDHLVNEFNPHGVTAEQVGKTVAQWNAAQLQNRDISTTAPYPSQVLSWDAAALRWTPANVGDLIGGEDGSNTLPPFDLPGDIGYVLTAADPSPIWAPAPPDEYARNMAMQAQGEIDFHEALRNNPHGVTAAQVGAITQSQADTRYVNVTGDGMTGPLTITGATASDMLRVTQTGAGAGIRVENTASDTTPTVINGSGIGIGTATPAAGTLQIDGAGSMIVLNAASPVQRRIEGKTGNLLRWQIILGNNAAETGSDAGSDYWMYRYDDLGTTGTLAAHVKRDSGNWGIGAAANTANRLLVNHTAAEAVVDARSIRALNLNTASDASANIEFATASGALRGAVRGKREAATNHGSLVLSSALSGVQQDVLTLASSKAATFTGAVFLAQDPATDMEAVTRRFLNSTIAGATGFVHLTGDTMTGPLNMSAASGGITIQGVSGSGGGTTYSPWFMMKSDWEQCYLQAWHQAGTAAGLYLVVGSTTPRLWNFRHDGILAAPGNVAIPQGSKFDLNNGGGCFLSMEPSGALVLYRAPGYYMVRGTDGTWSWVENNNSSMSVDASGNFYARGSVGTAGNFNLNNDRSIGWSNGYTNIYRASNGAWIFTAGADWSRFYFDPGDAGWRWQSGAGFGNTDMSLVAANLNVRGSISAGWSLSSADPNGPFNTGYSDGGGYYWGNFARAQAASDWMQLQAFHVPNETAQIRFWVLSTLFGMRNDGTAYAPGAWQDGCDERVKTDIQPITDALQKISQIEGVTYLRTDLAPLYSDEALANHAQSRAADPNLPETLTNPPQGRHAGFLAQSIKAVLPEAITVGETPPDIDPEGEGFNYLNSTAVLALTVQALKELVARVETLESAAP